MRPWHGTSTVANASVAWRLFQSTVAAIALVLTSPASSGPQTSGATTILIEADSSIVSFVVSPAEVTGGMLMVRIADLAGETIFEASSTAGYVEWMPAGSAVDGTYNYDVWFSASPAAVSQDLHVPGNTNSANAKKGINPSPLYDSGTLNVQFGEIEVHRPSGSINPSIEVSFNESARKPSPLGQLASVMLEWLIPSAQAAPGTFDDSVTINGDNPFLLLNDDVGGTTNVWWLRNQNAHFELFDFDCLFSCSGGENTLPLRIQNEAPNNAFFVGPTGNVGLGTSTPTVNLQITAGSPRMIMENTGSATKWMLFGASTGLGAYYNAAGSPPFWIFNNAPGAALSISGGSGNVGMGTFFPDVPLHVRRVDGTAQVLVEDSGGLDGQTMFSLVNGGGHPKFRLEDATQSDVRWEFRTAGVQGSTERFQMNKIGSGVLEFQLNAGGDAVFAGDVTANGVLLTSSRELKTDFSRVDEHTILEKVAALDVSQWRYTREPGTERHIGPMAEDFQAVFGLGDGKHISAGDANGILFAATKALKLENDSLKRELEELRGLKVELTELKAAVAGLQRAE